MIRAMENYINNLHSRGETLYSSKATRLKQPPRSGIFEDLGSSFKPRPIEKRRSPSISDFGSDEDSEDEMDCLSQSTQADEKIVTGKEPSSSQTKLLHAYHPDVLADRSQALKGLKFSKKSSSVEVENKKPSPRPKLRPEAKEPPYRSDMEDEIEVEEGTHRKTGKATDTPLASNMATISRPKPRPQPVTRPPPPEASGDHPESLFGTPTKKPLTRALSSLPLPSPLSYKKSTTAPSRDSKRTSPKVSTASLSSSSSSTTSSSSHQPPPDSSFRSMGTIQTSKSAPRLPQKFPSFSPLGSPATKRSTVTAAQSFPVLSPLSKDVKDMGVQAPKSKGRDKGKRKATVRNLQPFPMSTQDFGGISASSEDDSDVDMRHTRKRRYQGGDEGFSCVFSHPNPDRNSDSAWLIAPWITWIYMKRKTRVRTLSFRPRRTLTDSGHQYLCLLQ